MTATEVNGTSDGDIIYRTKDGVKFGKGLREKEFLFAEGYLNLNHGSFGTYPRCVRDKLRSMQDAAEARPDHFLRYYYPNAIDEARDSAAKLLNAPLPTLVFIPNATTGINTVLRSLVSTSNDHIIYFSTIYGACERTILYITETTPLKAVKINYTYPVEDDWLLDEFKKTVEEVQSRQFDVNGETVKGKVTMAIFDTIVSMPGVRFPFERMTRLCKELGVLSLIDGAHGVGHIDLNFGDGSFEPDFFVSNCHKWLLTPRPSALLYTPLKNQPLIRSTLPTSHGFIPLPNPDPSAPTLKTPFPPSADPNKTPWVQNFEFVGSKDNAPYLCVPTALAFRERLGGENVVMEYCADLALKGGKYIARTLGTEVLDNSTNTLTKGCAMTNVRLPIDVGAVMAQGRQAGVDEGDIGGVVRDWIQECLSEEYNTFIQHLFFGGQWWARVSAQVYLEMGDFEWAAEVLKEICGRVEKGKWVAGKKV